MELSFLDLLLISIERLVVYVGRPDVQRQLIAFVLIVLVAFLLGKGLENLFDKWVANLARKEESRLHFLARWRPLLTQLEFPVFGIILVLFFSAVFDSWGYRSGILHSGVWLFLLILIYRFIGAVLTMRIGEDRSRYYRHRLILPVILWILVIVVQDVIDVQGFSEYELFTLTGTSVTLGRLLTALFIFYLFIIGSAVLQDFLGAVVLPRTDADKGVVNSILAITRYLLIMLGVIVSLGTLGFSLSTLAVIGGGLSVGIGVGLQDIISNFIAGLLLIFEQSLRPGDVIELDGEIGTVEKLSIRSTVVRTLDNVELIVPNNTFLTDSVKTYTKSNRQVRIPVEVGVSYESDVHKVYEILMEVANKNEMVRHTPPPVIFFRNFGDSSLDFQLNVWVDEPTEKPVISSALHFAIWDAFQTQGIQIPFPQRDLHLRGGWEQLKLDGILGKESA